jgi:hypothetical protein
LDVSVLRTQRWLCRLDEMVTLNGFHRLVSEHVGPSKLNVARRKK